MEKHTMIRQLTEFVLKQTEGGTLATSGHVLFERGDKRYRYVFKDRVCRLEAHTPSGWVRVSATSLKVLYRKFLAGVVERASHV